MNGALFVDFFIGFAVWLAALRKHYEL